MRTSIPASSTLWIRQYIAMLNFLIEGREVVNGETDQTIVVVST